MTRLKKAARRTSALALILTSAGCSSVGINPFGERIVVRASTFCEVYRPVRAGEAVDFWDRLEAEFPEQSAIVRGNNLAWSELCAAR